MPSACRWTTAESRPKYGHFVLTEAGSAGASKGPPTLESRIAEGKDKKLPWLGQMRAGEAIAWAAPGVGRESLSLDNMTPEMCVAQKVEGLFSLDRPDASGGNEGPSVRAAEGIGESPSVRTSAVWLEDPPSLEGNAGAGSGMLVGAGFAQSGNRPPSILEVEAGETDPSACSRVGTETKPLAMAGVTAAVTSRVPLSLGEIRAAEMNEGHPSFEGADTARLRESPFSWEEPASAEEDEGPSP